MYLMWPKVLNAQFYTISLRAYRLKVSFGNIKAEGQVQYTGLPLLAENFKQFFTFW